jgi:PRTRC genetic system protein E
MFQALQPLLSTVASLTVSMVENADGTITLTVIPNGVKKGGNLDSQMQLVGTAAELDEGFAAHLISYTAKRQTLADQLAATEAILEAQQKEAADKAKKSIAKPAKKSSASTAESSEDPEDDEAGGDDDLGTSSTAPSSAEPSSTATTPAAGTPASDLWG